MSNQWRGCQAEVQWTAWPNHSSPPPRPPPPVATSAPGPPEPSILSSAPAPPSQDMRLCRPLERASHCQTPRSASPSLRPPFFPPTSSAYLPSMTQRPSPHYLVDRPFSPLWFASPHLPPSSFSANQSYS